MKKSTNRWGWLTHFSKWDLKMKLTVLLLMVSFVTIHANTYSQNTKISLDMENVPVEQVLNVIESSTEFNFLVNVSEVNVDRLVSVKVKKKRISEVLDQIFADTNVTYKVRKKQIILDLDENKPTALKVTTGAALNSAPVQNPITGKVTDATGMGLPGVNIVIVGSDDGTQTDFEGNYSIEASEGDVLRFSFVGMETQEVTVGATTVLNISMKEAQDALDEVVVVAYGTQKVTSVTSAVASVDVEKLGNVITPNIVESLQGRVPGLYIRDGGYNQGQSILIRGATTIGNNSPLYIVDGVPQDLLTVDPNDIENISVLKDGAAAAIYGSRAAAGVILITTKTGTNEKASFTFESFASWSNPTTLQKSTNSLESAHIMNEASVNSGGVPLFSADDIAKFESGTEHFYPDVKWSDELLKTEFTQRYFLSATGGSEKTSYYFSLGYRNADGIFKSGIDKTQYNLRTNLRTDLTDNLHLDVNLSYIVTDNTAPNVNNGIDNIYQHMNSTAPFLAIRQTEDPNSDFNFFNQAGAYGRGFWNVLWEIEAGTANTVGKTFTANTNLTWEIVDGLKFIGRFSGIGYNSKQVSSIYKRSTTGGPPWFSDVNSLGQTWRDNTQYNAQTFLNYEKQFGEH